MLALILAATICAAPPTTADRLAAYMVKKNPKAAQDAPLLARRILAESKAHGLDPAMMVAVSFVESRWLKSAKGSAHERGAFQLMPSDCRMSSAWARLQALGRTPGYPVASWRKLSSEDRTRALTDIRISTFMAAVELAAVIAWCKRAGHRIGRGSPPVWVLGIDGVHRIHATRRQYHTHPIDRVGHHQSGPRMPQRGYLRALRRAYRAARRVINGK